MIIKVGKYKTRDGQIANIFEEASPDNATSLLSGTIGDSGERHLWYQEGNYFEGQEHGNDLVEEYYGEPVAEPDKSAPEVAPEKQEPQASDSQNAEPAKTPIFTSVEHTEEHRHALAFEILKVLVSKEGSRYPNNLARSSFEIVDEFIKAGQP